MYDFLIVGSGLFGATFAHQMKAAGKSCLVIDKRKIPGGNIACENIEGINVHLHGPHIFHTNDERLWKFVNSFVPFNQYTYSPMASNGGRLFNLPFNMNTFYKLWGITDPGAAKKKIESQQWKRYKGSMYGNYYVPVNLEQQALEMVGTDLYELVVKYYTEKQWGRPCTDLPTFIIKRLPVRYTYDNNYFDDKYQGIPAGGYNRLIKGLLAGVEVKLNTDYFRNRPYFDGIAKKIVYTGPLDQFFGYEFGDLQYRSLRFDHTFQMVENIQGCAVINHTGPEVPYTRTIEHKHFEKVSTPGSVLTFEHPVTWQRGMEAYYPINDAENTDRYKKYSELAAADKNLVVGGRLGRYQYFNMDQVIASALVTSKKELSNEAS